ncbi:MAG: DnaA regulatory inactivator Hda [Rhizobacter sp.]
MKQIPLSLGLESTLELDDVVQGANGLALSHLKALSPRAAWAASSNTIPEQPAPIYLWGPQATGKTYLLKALARRWRSEGAHVGFFSALDPAPWLLDDSWSLVLLDDCDRFDAEQQQAAFTLFVEAATHGFSLVAAGRLPPVDLPLRDDLRTRLGWGHVLALSPLNESETRAAVRQEADRRGIFLSDEVMNHLLTHFDRDLKSLIGLLDRLDEYSLSHKRQVTVPLLKKMLAEEGGLE